MGLTPQTMGVENGQIMRTERAAIGGAKAPPSLCPAPQPWQQATPSPR